VAGVEVVVVPGLCNRTGHWAHTIWKSVYVDPLLLSQSGGTALLAHEMAHVQRWHRWVVIIGSFLTLGAAYPWLVKWCEIDADVQAIRKTDVHEFTEMVYTLPPAKTGYTQYIYGETREERINRALDVVLR
jgi:hypothetical protein